VVNDGVNCYLAPIKNAEVLAEVCGKMIAMSMEDRDKIRGCRPQKAVENFDEKIVINIYMRLIKDMMK